MKLLNEKNTSIFFILIGLVSVLPFIVLSLFAQPVTDDFWYASTTLNDGYFNAQYQWFMSITGRYFSTLLISANPLVFHWLEGIKLVPIILLVLFYLFCYLLIKELFINSISKIQSLGISSLITFVFFCYMPDTAYGIYFLTTAITFFLPNIFLLAFFYFLLKSYRQNKIKNKIFAALFAIFVVGGNEHSMLVILSMIIMINLFSLLENKRVDKFLLMLAIIIFIFTVFQLLSPGNFRRSHSYDDYNNKNFLFSLQSSIKMYFNYFLHWLPAIILMNLLFIKYFVNLFNVVSANLKKIFSINPFIILFGIFAISIGTIFIIYWSVGTCYFPHRSIISTYLFNILAITFLSGSILYKFKLKVLLSKKYNIFSLIIVFLLISFLISPSNRIRIAYGDIIKGRAYKYNAQFTKRYNDIEKCNSDTCIVDTLRVLPSTIFVTDIVDSCNDERNKYWAWYFNKKAIKTKKRFTSLN